MLKCLSTSKTLTTLYIPRNFSCPFWRRVLPRCRNVHALRCQICLVCSSLQISCPLILLLCSLPGGDMGRRPKFNYPLNWNNVGRGTRRIDQGCKLRASCKCQAKPCFFVKDLENLCQNIFVNLFVRYSPTWGLLRLLRMFRFPSFWLTRHVCTDTGVDDVSTLLALCKYVCVSNCWLSVTCD